MSSDRSLFSKVLHSSKATSLKISFDYSNGWPDDRSAELFLDGQRLSEVSFPPTGGWQTHDNLVIDLKISTGAHLLSLQSRNNAGPAIHDVEVLDDAVLAESAMHQGEGPTDAATLAATGVLITAALPAEAISKDGAMRAPEQIDLQVDEAGKDRSGDKGHGALPQIGQPTDIRTAAPATAETMPTGPATPGGQKPVIAQPLALSDAHAGGDGASVAAASPLDMRDMKLPAAAAAPSAPAENPDNSVIPNGTDPAPEGKDETASEDIMPFPIVFQDTDFIILDADTVLRNAGNTEPTATDDRTQFTEEGLRIGYSGEGYLDFGGGAGAKFSITIPANQIDGAGTYGLVIKFANGGTGVNAERPIAVFNGDTQVLLIDNTNTGSFSTWDTLSFDIELTQTDANGDYVLTFSQLGEQGPNIDGIALVAQGDTYSFIDPVFTTAGILQIAEGRAVIDTVKATDADGQDVTYAVSGGKDQALFTIDPSTGTLSFTDTPVYAGTPADNSYEVEITATDEAGASSVQLFSVNVTDAIEPIYIQAETGTVYRPDGADPATRILTQTNGLDEGPSGVDAFGLRPHYSGEGYVDFGGTGEGISYTVNAPAAGSFALHIRYSSSGPRNAQVLVDGEATASLTFPDTSVTAADDAFNNWSVVTTQVTLTEGENEISLYLNDGNGPNVDVLAITAIGDIPDFAPRFDQPGTFSMDEGQLDAGTVVASDVISDTTQDQEAGPVTYSITGGADAAAVTVDTLTGALSLTEAADFESKDSYQIEVTAMDDGGNATVQLVTISVNDVNEAPTSPIYSGGTSFAEDIAAGAVVGTVDATDPEAADVIFSTDDDRFEVVDGNVVVADGATFDAGETISLTLIASDGSLISTTSIELTVTPAATPELPTGTTFDVIFSADNITGYSGLQDNGSNFAVADAGTTLQLNDNHWKRVFLGSDYTITENTLIAVDVAVGANVPELIAVGFDQNENGLDADGSIWLLDGTDNQPRFVDMKGTGVTVGPGVVRYVIDLGAHAGQSIDSLVFISDDDSVARGGLGSVSFSNVQLIEGGIQPETNTAPQIIGGGLTDLNISEGAALEVDLPFIDPEGAALSFSFVVTDADGVDVTAQFADLGFDGNVMTGALPRLPGTYSVTVTANDGAAQNATASDSFTLTLVDVNDAPVTADVALEPYFGNVYEPFDSISISQFAEYFSDPDGNPLVLSVNEDSLPEGLAYDAGQQVIFGTPSQGGTFNVEVTATDPEGLSTTLVIEIAIDAPEIGDTFTIEAEDFTGLPDAEGFYVAAAVGASGNQLIRTNADQTGSISTDLSAGHVPPGYYTVSVTVYDETDGSATFSVNVGGTTVADNASFDDAGIWLNGDGTSGRGSAGQAGNRKTISFDTVVYVEAGTILTLDGVADNENLRIDSITLTRAEPVDVPPSEVTLDNALVAENDAGALIGTLSATDPDSETVSYTTEDARFVIDGDQLRLAEGVSLDHEADGTLSVDITASDEDGNATTTTLNIVVDDVNEAPELGDGANAGDVTLTGGAGGTVDIAAALGASDPEGDALSYGAQLAGGDPLPAGMTVSDGQLIMDPSLAEGVYMVEIFASDGSLDSESVRFTVTVGEAAPFSPLILQAEDATITLSDSPDGDATETEVRDPDNPEDASFQGLRPDYTGTGYVDYGNDPGDTLTFGFDVPKAGSYIINIRYASQLIGGAERVLDISVNGGAAETTEFPSTGGTVEGPDAGFNNWDILSVPVTLVAGSNTLSFTIPEGVSSGPNIDRIEVTTAELMDDSADADGQPLFLSGPDGDLSPTEAASINFNLAGIDNDIVTTELSFDGGATRVEVFPDADGDFTVDGTGLAPGGYTVITYVTDAAGNEASAQMAIVVAVPEIDDITIQAEDATQVLVDDTGDPADADFTRVVDADNPDAFGSFHSGAAGNAYLDFGTNPGDAVVLTVNAPAAGTYQVAIRYANGGETNRPLELSVNGGDAQTVDFLPDSAGAGWASWQTQTVTVELTQGSNQIRLELPEGADNGPNIDEFIVTYHEGSGNIPPFSVTVEGETFNITDTEAVPDTVHRTPDNPEPGATPGNSGPGQQFDADGLRPGSQGNGYLDMGEEAGDAAGFSVDVPDAGIYRLTVRYLNGGAADRPMTLSVNGVGQVLSFPQSSEPVSADAWQDWMEVTVDVTLSGGTNEISFTNIGNAGPNIDNVTISREGAGHETRDLVRFEEVVKINFQPAEGQTQQGLPADYETPEGYLADTGDGFGDRGNGFSYGWVSEDSVADGTANGTTPMDQPSNAHWYKDTVSDASDLQKTYAHFEYPGAGADGARAWEMALENGTYQVTLSVGDTAGAFDSNYVVNVEGQSFMPDWVPVNPLDDATDGGGFRSTLVTGIVQVTDGRLTIDSIGGSNTEIQYLEVEHIPDLTPDDDRTADQDYSFFTSPVASDQEGETPLSIGPDGELPTGIDPTAFLVVGVNLQAPGNRGPNIAYVEGVKLVETLTGEEVAINVQISGGADSLTIRPLEMLKEHTSYTLKVQDVMDLGSVTDADAPLRQMQDLTTTFVTGEAPEVVAREVAFSTTTLLNGFSDGAGGYTVIEFGPDGKLYIGTITGEIHRWDVNADGTLVAGSQETLSLDYLDAGAAGRRGIVGMVFDPNDPGTIWITDNAPIPRESKAFNTPEFSGRVSKITLGPDGDFDSATAETFAFGLPRSGGDHLTNSLEFRVNPAFGEPGEPEYLLYLSQGSNSAAGDPDNAWGNRPERLLNAAILEIDISREAPAGGFDLRTEPIDPGDAPTTSFPESQFNDDGTYPGMYNPFADDAVVKIFATGVRNGYDLVWHSNGNLYVPTNGTASGGQTPQDPTQPGLDTTISNSPKQYDYLFTVKEGGYYGHPNVLRSEYILNGGNPTDATDREEVVGGKDGNPNTDGYAEGVQPDPDYDLDGVYNLGYNRSPNGATEYTSNVFGPNLKGAVVFAQFSVGDNVRYVLYGDDGEVLADDVLRRPDGSVIDDYIDPLDIIENPLTGQLYLMTLNRGTGASQLILLTPAPGGVTQDLSADEGGDLALIAFDVSDPAAAVFQVNGLDDDITALRVSFDGGPATTVTLDNNNRFIIDLAGMEGDVTAALEVTDDALNSATVTTTFVPGEEPAQPEFISLVTIQAEDRTPGDGTTVTTPTSPAAEIEIRDASNPESNQALPNGLRPGSFGVDGNTDDTDGTLGGYADFGSTDADFLSFTFDVPAENAGTAVLRFRYANGGDTDRPLQVELNGTIIDVAAFTPSTVGTTDERWATWQTIDVPAVLAAGENTVTLRSVASTGPNIDQMEVLVSTQNDPAGDGTETVDGTTYVIYEAENAALDGPAVVAEDRTQSGSFVDFDGSTDQSITWTVKVDEAGDYGLDILYALASTKEARPMSLTVNGTLVDTLPFTPNSNAGETVWGPQQTTVALLDGQNTITLTAPAANGPNVDYLRITQQPITPFVAVPAEIDGEGRIELEAGDGAANTISGSEVVIYFTVAEDGVYQFDTAANSGAPNGQGLTWFLNGIELDNTPFPGVGGDAEESAFATLEAGTAYELRVVSDAPGASQLDYLDISAAGGNPNADIEVHSLDPVFANNRLHFSYIENPVQAGVTRDYKDTGTVRISNSGTEDLTLNDVDLTGPFMITSPAVLEGMTIAPGDFIDVTVSFDRSAYSPPTSNVDATSTVFEGRLRLNSNDAENPFVDVDLAGFWQSVPEGGMEPNVNEVWRIFGFGNRIEGLTFSGGGENSTLSTNDVFSKTDETEVLSAYWKLADGVTEARITQISAFHGPGGATIGIHNPGNKNQQVILWNHDGQDNQRLLPNAGGEGVFASEAFGAGTIPAGWQGDGVFGIEVANLSTDPRLNPTGGVVVPGEQQGHTVKVFQALDGKGNVIPNVYLGVMDYTGINYDYNDNMFVIEGVQPVGFGQSLDIFGLDDAAADDRLVFTNIDNPANAQQQFRNEATITLGNDGFAELTIDDIIIGDPQNFQIVGPLPSAIPAGGTASVTVQYIGTHPGSSVGAVIQNSTLTIISDDSTRPETVVQLAGIAQEFSENGSEPTVAQIVEAFGYGTDMAQDELAGGGVVELIGDEVLMPYMQALDPSQNIEVIQLAAFLNQGNVARLNMHGLGSSDLEELFAQDDQQAQTILPDGHVPGAGDTGGVARATISGDDPFGLFISVDGRPTYSSWSDPQANRGDPDFGHLVGDDQGHLIRFFQAKDAGGNVIEGTYIAIQDYPGAGNYDYNDHMFIIKNVQPYALTAADDANGDSVNDALQLDSDNDGTVDFFDPDTDTVPDPLEKGDYVYGVNFGGEAIALDPVLGVALAGQSDARVTLSGQINPGAGVDNAQNPNGAGAAAGSAFQTYEDGANWTATLDVPNGTYIVTLWTQETYWNAPGMRQFDATVNGQQVITDLDPFAEAGGDTPVAYEVEVTVTNGQIVIGMIADIDNAPLNAVTIHEAIAADDPADDFFLGVNFGGDAIALDPVLGVALVGQNDPRVTISGAVNPAQGSDGPGDPNGANAVTGSAFQTYEDGTNWTASIEVPDGTYLVTLWTQETYWNAAGLRQFDAWVNGQQVISDLDAFAQAGPDTPISFQTVVTVTNGQIDIDMMADINNAALNAVTIESHTPEDVMAEPGQSPFGGLAFQIGESAVSIDASDYDEGGQGVAYNDAPGLQGGSDNGRPGSDVEQTDMGHIGWIQNGEWLEYTVNVAEDGLYDISFLSAFGDTATNRAIEASFRKGGEVYETTGTVDVAPTGSWTDFQETDAVQVHLEAGLQVIRVAFSGGSQDLAAINISPSDALPVNTMSAVMAGVSGSPVNPAAITLPDFLADETDTQWQVATDEPDLADNDAAATRLDHVFSHDLLA